MSNSEVNFASIEKRISEIETKLPIELRVAVSNRASRFPQGGMRLLIALLVALALAIDLFWLPIPTWMPVLLLIPAALLPGKALSRIPGSQSLVWPSERKAEIAERASRAFRYLGMDNTKEGNAILLFVCTKEHRFHLLADSRLEKTWPAEDWNRHVTAFSSAMAASDKKSLITGISALLDAVEQSAAAHLTPRSSARHLGDGELANTVVVVETI